MADHLVEDPITEVRSLAQAALRTDRWHSFQPAFITTVGGTGLVGSAAAYLVSQKAIEGWTVPWIVGGAAFGLMCVSFVVFECRRMYERAKLLDQLFRIIQQYDILIRDARNERETLADKLVSIRAKNSALKTVLNTFLTQNAAAGMTVGGETTDETE